MMIYIKTEGIVTLVRASLPDNFHSKRIEKLFFSLVALPHHKQNLYAGRIKWEGDIQPDASCNLTVTK
jgi:hypothetical protein